MSSNRIPIWYAIVLWSLKHLFSGARHRRREYRKAVAGKQRILRGDGAWKVHAVHSVFSFEGICLQPVNSVGGGSRDDVDCHACLRSLGAAPVVSGLPEGDQP